MVSNSYSNDQNDDKQTDLKPSDNPYKHFSPKIIKQITSKMNIIERIITKVLIIFKSNKLNRFYFFCGMNSIEDEFSQGSCNWYDKSSKEIKTVFAKQLFKLTKGLAVISPILKSTIIHPDINNISVQRTPLIVEMIFHTLYTRKPLEEYPFSADNIYNNVTIQSHGFLKQEQQNKISLYLENISDTEMKNIDAVYTNFVYFSKLLNVPLLEFIKRFNFDINLAQKPEKEDWHNVTAGAVTHYIHSLYLIIKNIEIQYDDIEIILLFNKLYESLYPEEQKIPDSLIQKAWKNILDVVFLFKGNDHLLKCLRIARRNPFLVVDEERFFYTIHELFTQALQIRIPNITVILTNDLLIEQMNNILNQIIPNAEVENIGIGIYNASNSRQIEKSTGLLFSFVAMVVSIQLFIAKYFQPWFKNFLSGIILHAHFLHPRDSDKVDLLYRRSSKFLISFEHFVREVQFDSSIGKRLESLIQNQRLDYGYQERVRVFTSSINLQAKTVVDEFMNFFPDISYFLEHILSDVDNKTPSYIGNLDSMPTVWDSSTESKLNQLKIFCDCMNKLVEITFQEYSMMQEDQINKE